MDFYQAFAQVYRQAPCQVLPNAFWKTESEIGQANYEIQASGSRVDALRLWDENRLLVYWMRDPQQADFSSLPVERMQLALVHNQLRPYFPLDHFPHQIAYFRYAHSLSDIPSSAAPAGFAWQMAQAASEAEAIAGFIDACYPNMAPTAEMVLAWAAHPVCDPALWVWLVDEVSGQPAALGIAEFDPQMAEGSLEWVQVLPAYRRRGLGRAVVAKLLETLRGKARFATVSGEVDSSSQPGQLYRACGFTGNDLWWVLHK